MFKKAKIIILALSISLLSLPGVSHAYDYFLGTAGKALGFSVSGDKTDPLYIAQVGLKVFLSLLAIIFFGIMLYAGFRWMTARGNEDLVEKAQHALQAGIIGMIIVVSSYAISSFVFSTLVGSSTTTTKTKNIEYCCCLYNAEYDKSKNSEAKGTGYVSCDKAITKKEKCTGDNIWWEKSQCKK
ncbi:MAG: hypothetical protein ABIH87_01550 [bacterium]